VAEAGEHVAQEPLDAGADPRGSTLSVSCHHDGPKGGLDWMNSATCDGRVRPDLTHTHGLPSSRQLRINLTDLGLVQAPNSNTASASATLRRRVAWSAPGQLGGPERFGQVGAGAVFRQEPGGHPSPRGDPELAGGPPAGLIGPGLSPCDDPGRRLGPWLSRGSPDRRQSDRAGVTCDPTTSGSATRLRAAWATGGA
jgi:hypothetical protein